MKARARVMAGLGGQCAFCGSTTRALEIDHVAGGQGEGNAHRATLTKRLEYVLCDAYRRTGIWPTGYQLLCVTPERTGCHDLKSGRRRMPKDEFKQQVNLYWPITTVAQLEHLAKGPPYEGSKSAFLEALFARYVQDQVAGTESTDLRQQFAALEHRLLQVLTDTPARSQPAPAPPDLGPLEQRLTGMLQVALLELRKEVGTEFDRLTRRLEKSVEDHARRPAILERLRRFWKAF